MRSKNFKRLVVDASVARAAGDEDATASVSINCTEFLETFRDECQHHIVMTLEISEEWNTHQSNFATTWMKSMIARKRFDYVKPAVNKALSDKIEDTATHENQLEVMRKDFRLLEAALATDRAIISLDESIRQHFTRAAQRVGEIRNTVWVNPERTKERPLPWLQNGAQPEEHRQLCACPYIQSLRKCLSGSFGFQRNLTQGRKEGRIINKKEKTEKTAWIWQSKPSRGFLLDLAIQQKQPRPRSDSIINHLFAILPVVSERSLG